MSAIGLITEVDSEGFRASVVHAVSPACITCPVKCIRHKKSFSVKNTHGFSIKPNAFVKISYSKKDTLILGFVTVFLPLIFAVAGLLFSPLILAGLKAPNLEPFRFIITTTSLFAGIMTVYLITRINLLFLSQEIVQVL